jgi:hypothetical protein
MLTHGIQNMLTSGGLIAFARRIIRLCQEDHSSLSGGYSPLPEGLLPFARRITRLCQEDYSHLSGGLLAFVWRLFAFALKKTYPGTGG